MVFGILPTVQKGFQVVKRTVKSIPQSLDIISSSFIEPTTFVRDPVAAGKLVKERRKRTARGEKGVALGTIKKVGITTGALGGGALLVGKFGAIKGAKLGIGGILGGTILAKSPKAREFLVGLPGQAQTGGEIIADIIEDKPNGKNIGAKDALLAGGILAGIAASIAGLNKLLKDRPKRGVPGTPGLPGLPGVPGTPGLTQPIPPSVEPLGEAKPSLPAPKGVAVPTINNKISVKPEINVVVRNTRKKFINQQLLITA